MEDQNLLETRSTTSIRHYETLSLISVYRFGMYRIPRYNFFRSRFIKRLLYSVSAMKTFSISIDQMLTLFGFRFEYLQNVIFIFFVS